MNIHKELAGAYEGHLMDGSSIKLEPSISHTSRGFSKKSIGDAQVQFLSSNIKKDAKET